MASAGPRWRCPGSRWTARRHGPRQATANREHWLSDGGVEGYQSQARRGDEQQGRRRPARRLILHPYLHLAWGDIAAWHRELGRGAFARMRPSHQHTMRCARAPSTMARTLWDLSTVQYCTGRLSLLLYVYVIPRVTCTGTAAPRRAGSGASGRARSALLEWTSEYSSTVHRD